MIAKCPFRAITQAPTPRAMAALQAATLAVLIDLIFKFSDYRALLHVLPVAGCVKFSGTLMLVFLQVIVDVPEFLVVGERYGRKGILASIRPGIRVSHLNNFATLLALMGVPMSLQVRPYDKSIFSLIAEDNRVRYYNERLSSWIRRQLRGEDDTDTTGCRLGRFETCRQGSQV